VLSDDAEDAAPSREDKDETYTAETEAEMTLPQGAGLYCTVYNN